ncbi:MAG: hypothetical protein ACOC41_00520 [Chitinivibrionales bacterium]
MKPTRSLLLFFSLVLFLPTYAIGTEFPEEPFIDSVQEHFSSSVSHDPLLTTQHTQRSARSSALAYAGIALPSGPATAFLNPALLYAWGHNQPSTVIGISYGRDSIYQEHITGASICRKLSPVLSLGGLYRYLKTSGQNNTHEANVSLSGRLFNESYNQGPVDLGLNIRWELMKQSQSVYGSHVVHGSFTGGHGVAAYNPTDTMIGERKAFTHTENRFTLDIGFFQSRIAENIDFGITFTNLLGYWISKDEPAMRRKRLYFPADTAENENTVPSDTTSYTDSLFFVSEDSREWVDGKYRGLTAGIVFSKQLVQDKILIQIPLDIEFLGLLKRSVHTHTILRIGAELWINENYSLRFGYARAPMTYHGDFSKLENHHLFSGGAGFSLNHIAIDLYIKGSQEWGISAQLGF